MDNKKFGEFILLLRKERGWTQAELASKIHVTDKAVSKWERGLGFPDINTIKPLADALGVSVLEIMQSEKSKAEVVSTVSVANTLDNVISLVVYHRELEKRNIIISIFIVATVVLLMFLLDFMVWEAFFFVCVPLVCAGSGFALMIVSICRYRNKLTYVISLWVGIIMLMIPIIICLILLGAFALGGPVQG